MFENHRHLSEVGGDALSAVVRSAPPATATVAVLSGNSLETWVAIGTLVYLACNVAYLVWKWRREARAEGARNDG